LLAQPDRKSVRSLLETTLAKPGDKLVQSRAKDLMASMLRTE
jgi:hypothetical protein